MSREELADFLRRRREELNPDDVPAEVTLPTGRRARRTPGLRREEVAALARVSVSYYERMEQARAPRPSPEVLASLAAALRLTAAERDHLARLAGQILPGSADEREVVPAGTHLLLDRLGNIPGYVVTEGQDILAWNDAAVNLITDFARIPTERRNVMRLSMELGGALCDAPANAVETFTGQAAAQLHATRARHPEDRKLAELINEFAAHDSEFAAEWRTHNVRPSAAVRKIFRHPALGDLELDRYTLDIPGSGMSLVMYTAQPGSPSAAALGL
ncbi:helix-turn-helix transcriptional regulator [Streptomyces sp. NPDC058155]|uniref:helix-turn-helix transcriptional regulator n=1 Tax=Streptomyces sp. NPDC058155 TaxID=3346359 RepID=UPI0036EB1E20